MGRPCELRRMRRAVFGEPLLAHPPKIGWIDAPDSTHLVEHHRATGGNENCDGDEHSLDAAGTRRVIASIVPDRAAVVCAVVHIRTRSFRRRPTIAVRPGKNTHSWDDRLTCRPNARTPRCRRSAQVSRLSRVRRPAGPCRPPACPGPVHAWRGVRWFGTGHRAIRNSGPCGWWLHSSHVL